MHGILSAFSTLCIQFVYYRLRYIISNFTGRQQVDNNIHDLHLPTRGSLSRHKCRISLTDLHAAPKDGPAGGVKPTSCSTHHLTRRKGQCDRTCVHRLPLMLGSSSKTETPISNSAVGQCADNAVDIQTMPILHLHVRWAHVHAPDSLLRQDQVRTRIK